MKRDIRLVYNGMFKNEAGIITRMLESVYKHIDYYVIQDNGSTDGTPDIIKKFFDEKGIPGVIYFEPWVNFGYNRNHTLQKCLSLNEVHKCEYIVRVDADETLEVDDDFNWNMLRDADAWNVYCNYNNWTVYRMWVWKCSLPWEFTEFSRHETIQLKDDQKYTYKTLPHSFRHVFKGGGATWNNVYKYAIDGLELEKDQLNWFKKKGKVDNYHFFYTAKSYAYHLGDGSYQIEYPYAGYKEELARRCIWFFKAYLDANYPDHDKGGKKFNDWWLTASYQHIAKMYLILKEPDKFLYHALKAYSHDHQRNEALLDVINYYESINENVLALKYCQLILDNDFYGQMEANPQNYSNTHWMLPTKMVWLAKKTENKYALNMAIGKFREYQKNYKNIPSDILNFIQTYPI